MRCRPRLSVVYPLLHPRRPPRPPSTSPTVLLLFCIRIVSIQHTLARAQTKLVGERETEAERERERERARPGAINLPSVVFNEFNRVSKTMWVNATLVLFLTREHDLLSFSFRFRFPFMPMQIVRDNEHRAVFPRPHALQPAHSAFVRSFLPILPNDSSRGD